MDFWFDILPEETLQVSNQGNHPEVSSEATLNQTNGSTVQESQSPNTYSSRFLKKSQSGLSVIDRIERKKQIDRDYREREKYKKVLMQSHLGNLTRENYSLKEENQSLKKDNASMNQTLTKQAAMIEQLRSDLLQLKQDHGKQNVLLETLTQHLADPLRIENETLKAENASLRKSINLDGIVPQLLEENAKLKLENKVLKVQNDALCGKIISDGERKQERIIKMLFED